LLLIKPVTSICPLPLPKPKPFFLVTASSKPVFV